jgi:hypothetical protein
MKDEPEADSELIMSALEACCDSMTGYRIIPFVI